jgi:hypothetical protein
VPLPGGGEMQPRSTMPDARALLPRCRVCAAPMRIRTIEVLDRREDIRLACTACGRETIHTCQLGNQPLSAVMG